MSALREKVYIKTATGVLMNGELFVGADGLPELEVLGCPHLSGDPYRPATLPAAWDISPKVNPDECMYGPLLEAWYNIECIIEDVAKAQREAETEDRDRAQQREIDNRIAQELDERRTDGIVG